MQSFFKARKEEIGRFLSDYLAQQGQALGQVNALGTDICRRLTEFTVQGKMIRGALVSLGYALFEGHLDEESGLLLHTAAAVELIQSALLIHDDIMDQDLERRGMATVFQQYRNQAADWGVNQSERLGESLGICAGDATFFLAFDLLASAKFDRAVAGEIMGLWFREISRVCVAQMQDVLWGSIDREVPEAQILELYRYKTARYTFSMPLVSGAVLAHAPQQQCRALEALGEYLGLIFQIKDDELGIFASEGNLGKPIGSDIREGKKTLFYSRLLQKAGPKDIERLKNFGAVQPNRADLAFVRELIDSLGIRAEIRQMLDDLAAKTKAGIDGLIGVDNSYRDLLVQLLNYSLERQS